MHIYVCVYIHEEGLNRRQVGIMVSEGLQPLNNQFDKRYFETYIENS